MQKAYVLEGQRRGNAGKCAQRPLSKKREPKKFCCLSLWSAPLLLLALELMAPRHRTRHLSLPIFPLAHSPDQSRIAPGAKSTGGRETLSERRENSLSRTRHTHHRQRRDRMQCLSGSALRQQARPMVAKQAAVRPVVAARAGEREREE